MHLNSSAGPDYLIPYACFNCRKSWKTKAGDNKKCPNCAGSAAEMGRSLRAPKHNDEEQWAKVEALWNDGFRFWSFRSYPDAEKFPQRLRDVADFLRRNRDHPMRIPK
jgi:DNA-directed RNA polymerase subunit RPC12/RpoP